MTTPHLHKYPLPHDALLPDHLLQHVPALLQPRLVARVDHKHDAVHLGVIVLPDVADLLAAAEVVHRHVAALHLELDAGEADGRRHVLDGLTLHAFDRRRLAGIVQADQDKGYVSVE